jgi:hypothetical protein
MIITWPRDRSNECFENVHISKLCTLLSISSDKQETPNRCLLIFRKHGRTSYTCLQTVFADDVCRRVPADLVPKLR